MEIKQSGMTERRITRKVLYVLIFLVIVNLGIFLGLLTVFLDTISLAADYNETEQVVPVASTPTYEEVKEFDEPTAPTPEYEAEKPFERYPCTDDIYTVANGIPVTYKELHMLGLTIWGEANGQSKMEQAAVAWSILNRVDAEGFAMGESLTHVITYPGQFHGYKNTKGATCDDYYLELAKDVVDRWALEHAGVENVGRVLPKEYTFFVGRKTGGEWHNYFRTAYKTNEPRWDWSLPNPYEEEME